MSTTTKAGDEKRRMSKRTFGFRGRDSQPAGRGFDSCPAHYLNIRGRVKNANGLMGGAAVELVEESPASINCIPIVKS